MKFSSHKIWFKHNWRIISEQNPTYMFILFWKFFLPTWLIEPTCLFHFGKFSYLHIISNCTLIREVRVWPELKKKTQLSQNNFRNKIPIFIYVCAAKNLEHVTIKLIWNCSYVLFNCSKYIFLSISNISSDIAET